MEKTGPDARKRVKLPVALMDEIGVVARAEESTPARLIFQVMTNWLAERAEEKREEEE